MMELGVPNEDSFDFIDSTDEREEVTEVNREELKCSTVFDSIANGLETWSQSILDAESEHERVEEFRVKIDNSLQRQQFDGLLSPFDVEELRYIANLWIRLLHTISSYNIGCKYLKKDIISFMLELYSANHLDSKIFVDCCAEL